MRPGTAGFADAQAAGGQINVIINDKQIFQRHFIPIKQFADALAGEIHERLRGAEDDALAVHGRFGQQPLALALVQRYAPLAAEHFQRIEPRVMAGMGVLRARIPQPNDDQCFLFHGDSSKTGLGGEDIHPLR